MKSHIQGPSSGGTASNACLLEVRDLGVTYFDGGVRVPALEAISFQIDRGEFVAMLGPSGSGKSTMLDVIAGLVEPDVGSVALASPIEPTGHRLGKSAYMRQRDLLMPWRTVIDNAGLALEVQGISRVRARERVRQRLPEFGLTEFADSYPAQLSGGMRQRVAFLRTVLAGQELLLLDEPFGSLDALTRLEMQMWLLRMLERERRTVLLVTHDVDEAVLLADRVIVLSDRPGRIVSVVPIDLQRPRSARMATSAAFLEIKKQVLSWVLPEMSLC